MAKHKRKTETPARRKAIAEYRKARSNVITRIKRYEKQGLEYSGERPETATAIKGLTTAQIKKRTRHIKEDLTPSKTLHYTHNALGVSGYQVRHAARVEAGKKSQEWTEEKQRKRDDKYKEKIRKNKDFAKQTRLATAGIDNFKRCINGSLMASSYSDLGTMVLHALQTSITNDGYDKTAEKIQDMWDLVDEYFSSFNAMYDGHTPGGISDAAKQVTENLQGELSEEQGEIFDEIGEEATDANEGIIGGADDKEVLSSGVESQVEEAKAFYGKAIDNKYFQELWHRLKGYVSEEDQIINISLHLPRARYLLGVLNDKKAKRKQIYDAMEEMITIMKGL